MAAEFGDSRADCGSGRVDLRSWTILGVILPEKGLPGTRLFDDVKTEGHTLRARPAASYRPGSAPGAAATGRYSPGAVSADELF
jgi:hypothetical protein